MNSHGRQRRRLLCIVAASGAAAWPALAQAGASASVWRGQALGAPASMTLLHPDHGHAQRTLAACEREIERLEAIFSLYRDDAALVRLNRQGALAAPPLELVELLAFALQLARRSGGRFDPTVQPLYRLYADHFARPAAAPAGPSAAAIARTLRRVDHRAVQCSAQRIALLRPGMALTLNGVAQGYLTDRMTERLRAAGFDHVLVDLGEARALGRRADGRPWQAVVADPRHDGAAPGLLQLPLGDAPGAFEALATSAGAGTVFGPDPRLHHLLDARTGRSANAFVAVSVSAPRATVADGLSTALALTPAARHAGLLGAFAPARAWALHPDGGLKRLG